MCIWFPEKENFMEREYQRTDEFDLAEVLYLDWDTAELGCDVMPKLETMLDLKLRRSHGEELDKLTAHSSL